MLHGCVKIIRVVVRKKRDYVGKIPKLGGGRSDPNPLLDVYLPNCVTRAPLLYFVREAFKNVLAEFVR